MIKKYFSVLFCCVFAVLLTVPAFAALYTPEEEPDADVIYMLSLDNGAVVCDINSTKRIAPASVTKIVTAILTIENCQDFDDIITVPYECLRLLEGTNSSTAGLLTGEQMTVKQMLYCLLVASANDAANVLAYYIGNGDIEAFVSMMNDFVQKLGCSDTHFVNAHGLDDDAHYTTARDIAAIYKYCLNNSMFCEITGTYRLEVPATNKRGVRNYTNTNQLMNPGIKDYYCAYVKNGKTGTTNSAGRCVVSSASNNGYNYLLVVMNAKFYDFDDDGVDENMAFVESRRIYDWVFKNLKIREVANPSMSVYEAEVRLSSERDWVRIVPETSVSALVPGSANAENVLIEPYPDAKRVLDAPVKKGDVVGKAAIKYAGEVIGEVNLVADNDVARSTTKYVGDVALRTVKSHTFWWILLGAAAIALPLLVILYVVIPARRRKKKNTVNIVSIKDRTKKDK